MNEMQSRCDFIRGYYLINLGLTPLCNRFKELASLYSKGVSSAYPSFESPEILGIDRLKTAQADILEIANGLNTMEVVLRKKHLTFEEVVADKTKREAAGFFFIPDAQSNNMEANPNSAEV